MSESDKKQVTKQPSDMLSRRAIESNLSRMEGWTLKEGGLAKSFGFASPDEAVKFTTKSARKAASAGYQIDVSLRGAEVGLTVHPLLEQLSRGDMKFARRLDPRQAPQGQDA